MMRKPVALLADAVLHGDGQVVEEDEVRVDGVPAHLVDGAHLDPGAVEPRVEQAQSVGLARHGIERRRTREDERPVGDLGGRNPDLLAADDIGVAAALGPGLELRRVEAGVGLGHGEAGLLLAADQRRQHARLLLLRSEHHDGVEPEDVHVHRGRAAHAGAGLGNGLHHHRGLGDA
jgi:hypothetical protein